MCSCTTEKLLSHPGATSPLMKVEKYSSQTIDCNHDKPEGKTARTGKRGERARVLSGRCEC